MRAAWTRFTSLLLTAALLLGLTQGAEATPRKGEKAGRKKATAKPAKAKFTKPVSVKKRLATRKLHDLLWHDDWKTAVTVNRREPAKARPIFFLRILGDLAGGT